MATLFKPQSESSYNPGALTVLTDHGSKVMIRDKATGEILEEGRNTGASNGYGGTFRFTKPGSNYNNVEVVNENGEVLLDVSNGAQRLSTGTNAGGTPTNPIQSEADARGFVAAPAFVDPGMIQFNPITPTFIKNRELTPNDILGIAKESIPYAQQVYRDSLSFMKGLYPQIAGFAQTQISQANQFNQMELDKAFAKFPQIRAGIEDNFKRAQVFKAGGIPDSLLNRALDTGIRSKSSDLARYSGIGSRSAFAGKVNSLITAEESLKLMDKGTELEKTAMAQAEQLISKPQRFEARGEEYLENIRKENTITSKELVDEMEANRELNVNIDKYNADNQMAADKFNAEGLYQASVAKAELAFKNATAAQAADQLAKDYYLQSLNREYFRQLELEDRKYYEDIFRSQQNDLSNQQDIADFMSILGLFGKGGIFGSGGLLGGENGFFGSGGLGSDIWDGISGLFGSSSSGLGSTGSSFADLLTSAPTGAIGQNANGSFIMPDSPIDINIGDTTGFSDFFDFDFLG